MIPPVRFKLDSGELDKFAHELKHRLPDQARAATATALNRTAKGAELLAKKNVKQKFQLRNKWTLRSIQSTKTPLTRPIDRQFTLVGSRNDYMARQEAGGALPQTSEGRRLTTARGSREGATAYPRKKVAKGMMKSKNIRLRRNPRVRGSKGRQAFTAVRAARSAKRKFVFLDLGQDRKGIFRVLKRKIHMVHAFIRRPMRVQPRPWLGPAVAKSRKIAPSVFRREMEVRFKMGRIFSK